MEKETKKETKKEFDLTKKEKENLSKAVKRVLKEHKETFEKLSEE